MDDQNNMIIGCSFDGLKDRFFVCGRPGLCGNAFYLKDVVLPLHNGGRLLTGDEAERSRISTGYCWPPEAQVRKSSDYHLRRVPVPWAWRILVDAKDKYIRWKVGGGVSFGISRILAAHIASQLGDEKKRAAEVVIAIPNHLDEFGQEELLKDLVHAGVGTRDKRPRLLWRPVSAALAWLNRVQDQFPASVKKEDFILVVHIGPDCVEFATFRLREKKCGNRRFIIPLREPPKDEYVLCGCDWVAESIKSIFSTDDPAELWQGITNLPETWEALGQRHWKSEELPRVWSRGKTWDLWEPAEEYRDRIWQLEARASSCLEELTRNNCEHDRPGSGYNSWKKFLQKGIETSVNACTGGKLWGVILSGPLASRTPRVWLEDIMDLLRERGLESTISQQAQLGGVWTPLSKEDAVSEGAAIYGNRLLRGEPTYLDTLQQLSTLAMKREKREWIKLLKDTQLEIEGGHLHKNTLRKSFILKRGSKTLDVWLKKGDSAVYKKSTFLFPYEPPRDMPLDTEIRMSSASGLAQVELVPEEKYFLGGQRVFLDYSRMENTKELPPVKLCFPDIAEDHLIDDHDYRLLGAGFRHVWDAFLTTDLTDRKYDGCVHSLREEIQKSRRSPYGGRKYTRIVNKDGKTSTAEGQAIIDKISAKLGKDFKRTLQGEINNRHVASRIICKDIFFASTWLFSAASREVISYLKKRLKGDIRATERIDSTLNVAYIIHGAGRCLSEKDDMTLLYKAAIGEINYQSLYANYAVLKSYWVNALWRVLRSRDYAPDAMERHHAMTLVKDALNNMGERARRSNFKVAFRRSTLFFLYLLRFRIKDRSFLSYEIESDRELFKQIITYLEMARRFYKRQGRTRRTEKQAELMEEIKKYMRCEGTNLMHYFSDIIDEASASDSAE